ncbi:MAG: flagellar hook-length control protein FliK [Alphaproteobacteria bacterium]
MSAEQFFTIQAHSPSLQGQRGKSASAGQAQGLSFVDIILAQIAENLEKAKSDDAAQSGANTGNNGPLETDNPALDKNPGLHLAEIIAANAEIREELKDFLNATQLGPDSALTQALELNRQAFDDVLKPLTGGLITSEEIAKGSPRILQAFLIESPEEKQDLLLDIRTLEVKIKAAIEGKKHALTLTNLTPEQVTALQNLPEGAALPEELEGNPFLVIIQLAAVKGGAGAAPSSLKDSSLYDGAPGETTPGAGAAANAIDDDPAVQNLIAVLVTPANQPQQNSAPGQGQAESFTGRLNALNNRGNNGEPLFTIAEYEGSPQAAEGHTGKGKNADAQNFAGMLKNAGTGHSMTTPSPDLSFLQGGMTGVFGSLSAPTLLPGTLEEYGLNTASGAPSTLGTMTSVVTQAHSAQGTHPAVQAVAVQLQKTAGGGENKTLTLQLEPPELGRVHVKMEFGHNKTLKAILTTEKPESFMMMQRDAHVLERALQDAGLDIGEGLSFELAEHGFDFDQDNRRGGGHDQGGTGGSESAAADEAIETTMTWHIDPETGHTRYDILA